MKYCSFKYRCFFFLFPHATIWRPLFAFLPIDFSIPRSSSFPSVGRVKRKAPLALSMANEASVRPALIERRFTFGRYFINPKRLAARKNLALPCDPKAVPCLQQHTVPSYIACNEIRVLLSNPRCYTATRPYFSHYNFPIFTWFNTPADCYQRNAYKILWKLFNLSLKKKTRNNFI